MFADLAVGEAAGCKHLTLAYKYFSSLNISKNYLNWSKRYGNLTFGADITLLLNKWHESPTRNPTVNMIRLKNIRKSYQTGFNHLEVLKGIDLQLQEGAFASIMGSSGSGKSTLLNILGILDEYDEGEYYLDGKLIQGLSQAEAAQYRNQFIGFVFQSFNLLPFKTAAENVALPLYYQKVDRAERHRRALEYLDMVGLADWSGHLPTQLSGGQQQRVAIARALITQPKVILADEPTGALDSQTSYDVMGLFKKVNGEGMTVLIVTHENDIAAMTRQVIRLRDGIIESNGSPVVAGS